MTGSDTKVGTKRILVTLDTSARGQAALDAAVRFALAGTAQLDGLFVEDENLLRLARLPFSCEIDFASATTQPLQLAAIERALRTASEHAQRALEEVARQLNLEWSFHVARGSVAQASLAASAEADLLIIGQGCRSLRESAESRGRSTRQPREPVVVLFDGTPACYRAIETASHLAQSSARRLSVLVLAKDAGEGRGTTQQCLQWLQSENVSAKVEPVLDPSAEVLLRAAQKWRPSVVVFQRDCPFIDGAVLGKLVDQLDCPLAIVS